MADEPTRVTAYAAADQERWVGEPGVPGRSPFARDRARVLHSASFRRLAAKTQIHVAGAADFPRTRLTHTLEVAQIGRELGAALGCDPDLVDVAGLAHDLGHPPFGHNGETVLDEVARPCGGFEGNAQTLRVLTRLEAKRLGPTAGPRAGGSVGLNLTRASLDAATKYPWLRREGHVKFGVYEDDLDVFTWMRSGADGERRCIEAQVMDFADDVAYSVHDLEDAVHAGHVDVATLAAAAGEGDPEGVLESARAYARGSGERATHRELAAALRRLLALDYWPRAYDGSLRSQATLKDLTSRLIGRFCAAAEEATRVEYGDRLTRYGGELVVARDVRLEVAVLKAVANRFVMQRDDAQQAYARQRELVLELCAALRLAGRGALEPAFRDDHDAAAAAGDDAGVLRVVVDQVASLTDTSVVAWHRRHCR